jgi:hypothetical protein
VRCGFRPQHVLLDSQRAKNGFGCPLRILELARARPLRPLQVILVHGGDSVCYYI